MALNFDYDYHYKGNVTIVTIVTITIEMIIRLMVKIIAKTRKNAFIHLKTMKVMQVQYQCYFLANYIATYLMPLCKSLA